MCMNAGSFLTINLHTVEPHLSPLLHQKGGLSKRGGLSSGEEIITFVKIYIVRWPFQRGLPLVRVASCEDV